MSTEPSYCIEKSESGAKEKSVYWDCPKHVHDATLIKYIERKQSKAYAGTQSVRASSFPSNQPRVLTEGLSLKELTRAAR
jgi:hypothetical protein